MSDIKKYTAQIRDVQFGTGVTVVEPLNLYECEIGNDVFVGPFVEIQKGVKIGDRTRIQSHTFICELVTIGSDCFIAHGVMFTNDLFKEGGPSGNDKTKWSSTEIGNHVSIVSNVTLLPVAVWAINISDLMARSASSATVSFARIAVFISSMICVDKLIFF